MSGPKCTEWSVVENLRLAALARIAAWDLATRLEAELALVCHAFESTREQTRSGIPASLPKPAARPASAAAIGSINAYVAQLRGQVSTLRAATSQMEARAKLSEILAAAVRTEQARPTGRDVAQKAALEDQLRARATEVDRILSRLPALCSQKDRESAQATAAAALAAATHTRAEALQLELRALVQEARENEAQRVAQAARAEVMLADLLGLSGEAIDRAVARLQAVVRGENALDPILEADVAVAAKGARAEADRAYAADVLKEEFESLGYEVGSDFLTAFASGGKATIHRQDRSYYDVRVQIDPQSHALETRLVRRVASEASGIEVQRQDFEAETAWCSDFGHVLAAASKRNVRARVVRQIEPGAEPLPVIAPREIARRGRADRVQTRTI